MAVTTTLIGKLGGGGAPEVEETAVSYSTSRQGYWLPSGWRKAHATFRGTAAATSPTIFDQKFIGLVAGASCSGGGVVTGYTSFQGAFGTITWVRLE